MKKLLRILLKTLLIVFVFINVVVIFQAYKLTHFYNIGEAKQIPQNQKSGWDKTKDIFFGANNFKQPNIAPDSNFSVIYLTTKDSIKLQAWSMPVANAKGTVILFHGHGSKKSAVLEEAYQFNKLGYNTFLLDFRAHGSSGGNTTTIGFKESEDVDLAYNYIQKSGEKNIILWGISMGAATITKAIHDYNISPSKVILEMPFASLPDAVEGRIRMMKLPPQPLSTLLTFWGGTIHGFWAFNLRPVDYAKDIKCPVLVQWGKQDPRVTEKEVMDIYNNITTPKKLVIYDNSGHESLYKKEPAKWLAEVTAFLQ